jgi:hypothetical protein
MESENRDEKGRYLPGHGEPGPGRPKFSVLSIIKEKLQSVPEGEKRSLIESLVDEYLVDIRERKDGVAVRDIIDRYDGKPKQTVHVENEKDAEWLEYLKGLDAKEEEDVTG